MLIQNKKAHEFTTKSRVQHCFININLLGNIFRLNIQMVSNINEFSFINIVTDTLSYKYKGTKSCQFLIININNYCQHIIEK